MSPRLNISAKDIVADIRSGMTNAELMTRYNVTAEGLESAFKQLLDGKVITTAEFDWRPTEYYDTVVIENVRRLPRIDLAFKVPVMDRENPGSVGTVRDISEQGLQTQGIKAEIGEIKNLVIVADQLARVGPLSFFAECRWAKTGRDNDCIAGFLIKKISKESLQSLRDLLRLLAPKDG